MGILKNNFLVLWRQLMLSDAIHICLNYTEIREPLGVDHLMQHSLIGRN